MMRSKLVHAVVLSMALAGCDSDPKVAPDSGAAADAGAQCAAPTANFGTSEGANLVPFTLEACDGTAFEFYGDREGFCDAKFTVLSIAAGWCQPCRMEASLMEEHLVQAYAEDDVRVVVALIANNDSRAPSPSFCEGWVDQYGLTNPVLLDEAQETQIYFPAGALPATLIVDSRGVIRHREYGVSTDLETVRGALDRLLDRD